MSAEGESRPLTFKEKMAMFNKKKDFKVETPYDAIRRERAERKAAKAAKAAAKAAAAKGATGSGGSSDLQCAPP